MKRFIILALMLSFVSCKSPAELMERGDYNAAFTKAVKEVEKGKSIPQNTRVIQRSAGIMVDEAVRYASIKSTTGEVKDWIKTQKKLFKLLKKVGKANHILKGEINEPYDQLCNQKKDIDYQIVEYYYESGHDNLDHFYNRGEKEYARNAYFDFEKCEKFEGGSFFLNLGNDKSDAYENGVVYYVSDYDNIGSQLFLKPLPRGASFEPDCDIVIDHGFVTFSTSEESSIKEHVLTVETGKEEVKDTAGNVTFIPILEDISANVITNTITVIAEVTTSVVSRNITGQCTLRSHSFTTKEEQTYDEVIVEGNTQALRTHVDTHEGEPSFFRRDLERELLKIADSKISL